ncbi:T9SS type A sorting domain-containing protein [bacterium]|nr:T9SS type A sorting domain-containing protein [bacterium]
MKYLILICLIMVLSCYSTGWLNASEGGPDAFGYRWIDSAEPSGPRFEWIEISGTGVNLNFSDDTYRSIVLSQPFNYYGKDYYNVHICSNGWISLKDATSYITVGPFPNASYPNAVVGILNMDLDPYDSPGQVYYQIFEDKMVVEYFQICEYPGGSTYPPLTFEIVLDFARNSILFQYLNIEPVVSTYRTAYIGIEDSLGMIGLQYGTHGYSSTVLSDSLAIMWRSAIVISPVYHNDFDLSGDDFLEDVTDSGCWQWGNPSGPGPASAHSGSYCFGTRIAGDYPNSANSYLYFPRMALEGTNYPYLDFWHWYDTDEGQDGGNLQISTNDGVSWSIIIPDGGYPTSSMGSGTSLAGQPAFSGDSEGWQKANFDLSFYMHEEVRIRFHFASDEMGHSPGWYIDDASLIENFGFLMGQVDLTYEENDGGAIVQIVEQGLCDTTDTEGYYYIDSVMVGTYTILTTAYEYAPGEANVNITRLDTVSQNFTLFPQIYFNDFEENPGPMLALPVYNGWQWGAVDTFDTTGPVHPHSPHNCWATRLDSSYANAANWTLDLYISLDRGEHPRLEFWHWYDFDCESGEDFFDGGNVKITRSDDSIYTILEPQGGYPGYMSNHNPYMPDQPAYGGVGTGNFWHMAAFDLTDWVGQSVKIRFELGADYYGTAAGWYIDDMRIVEGLGTDNSVIKLPRLYSLSSYPNPFNHIARIQYALPEAGNTRLTITNLLGQKIVTLVDNYRQAGSYSSVWDGADGNGQPLPSGLYLLNLYIDHKLQKTHNIIMLK